MGALVLLARVTAAISHFLAIHVGLVVLAGAAIVGLIIWRRRVRVRDFAVAEHVQEERSSALDKFVAARLPKGGRKIDSHR